MIKCCLVCFFCKPSLKNPANIKVKRIFNVQTYFLIWGGGGSYIWSYFLFGYSKCVALLCSLTFKFACNLANFQQMHAKRVSATNIAVLFFVHSSYAGNFSIT
jgi:hypothetical protein